jgi:hypothetical protein
MEATGMDGGRGPWSYREQPGSSSCTISSTSGTVSTTGYTSTGGSHLSWISMETAMLLEEMGEEDTQGLVQPVKKFRKETEVEHTELDRVQCLREMKMKQIKSLAEELFGAPSAKGSIEGADMSLVLEKWFNKLGVGWVLRFSDGAGCAAAGKLEQTLDISSWIRALTEINHVLWLAGSLCPGHGSSVKGGGPATESEEQEDIMIDQVQIASFAQHAILKLLAFVDFVDVPNLNITWQPSTMHLVAPAYQKLYAMLRVYNALITGFSSYPPASAQVGMIHENVVGLLSAKQHKAGEAIWNTMEEIWNRILESVDDGDDSASTQHPQGSPDIHKATRSMLSYIRFLGSTSSLLKPIISEAARLGKYVLRMQWKEDLAFSLNAEMMSCVQEKLANKSEKFTDQSLRFIFLLNNLSFMGDTRYFPASYNAVHTGKVVAYMESYMEVAWAPVLACLFNLKPLRLFGKNYSPLLKFESEFHKTYTTQKLWKVPDPKLRKTLREAIIVKMVPSYRDYLEDNKVTTPKFTPWDLEKMLLELFEG